MSQLLPPSAVDWNNLFNLAAFIAMTATAIVVGAMIFFVIKYREKKVNQNLFQKLAYRKIVLEKL